MRIAIVLLAVICLQYCFAKPPLFPTMAGYPGYCRLNGGVIHLHSSIMNEGIKQFYQVYQRWPETWQEVRDSGLVQVPLIAPCGLEVDPDDNQIDFVYDNVYIPPANATSTPFRKSYDASRKVKVEAFTSTETLAVTIKRSGKYPELIGDSKRLTQFAMCRELDFGVLFYRGKFNRSPSSLDDVLRSGLCALDQNSVNPLTGDVLHGDGRPNGFLLYPVPGLDRIAIFPVDEHGRIPWDFSDVSAPNDLPYLFRDKPVDYCYKPR